MWSRLDLDRCTPLMPSVLFVLVRLLMELELLIRFASGSSTGRGILDSQGMSGEGGAMTGELDVGPDMIPSATL